MKYLDIYLALKNGGYFCESDGISYNVVLGTKRAPLTIIYFCHYGSSSEPFTLEKLIFIIKNIFNMTADEFSKKYSLKK